MCYEQQKWPDGRHLSGEFSQRCQMPVAGLSCYFCSLGHSNSFRQDLKPGELDERLIMCNKWNLNQHCLTREIYLDGVGSDLFLESEQG